MKQRLAVITSEKEIQLMEIMLSEGYVAHKYAVRIQTV
jgi:hypothetical protein